MRPPSDMPPPRPRRRSRLRVPAGRGRIALIVVLVVLFVLATSLRGIAAFYTDLLWFDSLDLSSVWRGIVGAKVGLAATFTFVFFVLMWANLAVAERLSGRTLRFGGSSEDELVLRYRELVGRRATLVRAATSGAVALIAGASTAAQWNTWVLFRNRVDFGVTDATFGRDVGFYVFELPFLQFVTAWLFQALVVVVIVTVVAHYLNGGIRLQAAHDRVSAPVKAHISVLLAALALVRAGQYRLDRYELVYSTRGPVNGAAYTDVNVQLRAIDLLVLISLFATVLFLVNIRRRGWVLPVMAVGIWGVVAVLAGEAVPAFVQRFRVDGQAVALEAPYVAQNIEATRAALALDGVEEREFDADYDLSGADLEANQDTVQNIRLWDPPKAERSFRELQGLRSYFDVNDVDIDRYTVDGEVQQVLVAPRELDDGSLPTGSRGWQETHLIYTSGYGAVMAPANAKTGDGRPDFVVAGLPVTSREGYPEVVQPELYFGEGQGGYKIVDTGQSELQVVEGDTPGYDGEDGVLLSSFVRRAAFALRFGDVDIVTSGSIQAESRMLMQRDVRDRVQAIAPFLALDADPYPVVLDGRVVYVLDAYTTTDRYPNAQRVSVDDDLLSGSGLRGRSFNYARNPVKAVVDAYDGTVTLYVVDDEDPLLQAYRKAFPDLFTPVADAPEALVEHFRYPEDLFRAQTVMWGRYHITDTTAFQENRGRWSVAAAPESGAEPEVEPVPAAGPADTTAPVDGSETEGRIEPTYQLLRLPGDESQEFVLVRPFTVRDRAQLSAFLTARDDGRLVSFNVPAGQTPIGPAIASDRMQNEEEVGQLRTFFDREGSSEVTFGNVLMVPIDQSVLYVQSVYVAVNDNQPNIRAVIAARQDGDDTMQVAVQSTLRAALLELFTGVDLETLEEDPDPDSDISDVIDGGVADEPSPDEPASGDDAPEEPDDPAEPPFAGDEDALIAQIQDAFDRADQALLRGDLAAYQAAVEDAEQLVAELAQRREEDPAEQPPASGEASGDGGGTGDASGGTGTTTPPTTAPASSPSTSAPAPTTTRPSA